MKVLIAYDGSIYADAAIEDMRRAGLPPVGEALVLAVVHDPSVSELTKGDLCTSGAANRIQSYFPKWTVDLEVLWGAPAKVILEHCQTWNPDLLIVGSHGRSATARLLLGSVSLKLIHEAPCSVRLVRLDSTGGAGPIRVIVGYDGSMDSDAAVRQVGRRFWPAHTDVRVVSIVEALVPQTVTALEAGTYAAEPAFKLIKEADDREWTRLQTMAEGSAQYLRERGLTASPVVVAADPAKELIDQAAKMNADAIFVGERGIGRVERLLLGSVSTAVATHAGCTVEIVRSK